MINDLLKDGIIADPNDLSFRIGTDEFVVNYVKQPEAVYQKYRARYVDDEVHRGEWIWYYQFETRKWEAMSAHKRIRSTDPREFKSGIFRSNPKEDLDSNVERTKQIISDMMKDGIVTDTDDLSFKTGNNKFIVNYKRQPEAIHRKYRSKYIDSQNDGQTDWYYHYDNSKMHD